MDLLGAYRRRWHTIAINTHRSEALIKSSDNEQACHVHRACRQRKARYRPLRPGRAHRRRCSGRKGSAQGGQWGALRARQLAKKLIRGGVDEARVILGWAAGDDAPFLVEASSTQGGVNLQIPRQEFPPDEWFRIEAIVGDLELTERDWATDLLAGYFCQPGAPWER